MNCGMLSKCWPTFCLRQHEKTLNRITLISYSEKSQIVLCFFVLATHNQFWLHISYQQFNSDYTLMDKSNTT